MPQLDSDSFTYSNGLLATVSSAKWTKLSGFNDCGVLSNQLSGGSIGSDNAVVITSWSGSTTDQYSQVVWKTAGTYTGPTVHSNAVSSFYYLETNVGGGDIWRIGICNAGSFTTLSSEAAMAVASGDICYLEWVSGVLTAKKNSSAVVNVSDSTLASGKPGIRIWDPSLGVSKVDDWAAGDFSAGGITYPELERSTRGVGRGLVTGVALSPRQLMRQARLRMAA